MTAMARGACQVFCAARETKGDPGGNVALLQVLRADLSAELRSVEGTMRELLALQSRIAVERVSVTLVPEVLDGCAALRLDVRLDGEGDDTLAELLQVVASSPLPDAGNDGTSPRPDL